MTIQLKIELDERTLQSLKDSIIGAIYDRVWQEVETTVLKFAKKQLQSELERAASLVVADIARYAKEEIASAKKTVRDARVVAARRILQAEAGK